MTSPPENCELACAFAGSVHSVMPRDSFDPQRPSERSCHRGRFESLLLFVFHSDTKRSEAELQEMLWPLLEKRSGESQGKGHDSEGRLDSPDVPGVPFVPEFPQRLLR
jgi:hypothetical protein